MKRILGVTEYANPALSMSAVMDAPDPVEYLARQALDYYGIEATSIRNSDDGLHIQFASSVPDDVIARAASVLTTNEGKWHIHYGDDATYLHINDFVYGAVLREVSW